MAISNIVVDDAVAVVCANGDVHFLDDSDVEEIEITVPQWWPVWG